MGAGDLTILDLRNILEWHELISDKNISSEEQYLRTKVKVQGYLVSMEDSFEPLATDLIGTVLSGLESAKYSDLQVGTKPHFDMYICDKSWNSESFFHRQKLELP